MNTNTLCAGAILLLVIAGCGSSGGGTTTLLFIPNFGAVAVVVNDTPVQDTDNQQVCCDGLNVYVVWQDNRNGENDIFFNYSRDGGVTWQPNDTRLDTDTPGAFRSNRPKICCDGQRIYVAWEDERNNSNNDIFFNYSEDGGVSWQASDTRLDTDAPAAGDSIGTEICCSGLNVYVAWEDNRDGEADVYFNYSADGGMNWQLNDIRLDTDTAGAASSDSIEICCSGLDVYVVWEDDRAGSSDVLSNYSHDGGATWQLNDVRIDLGNVAGASTADSPEICCDGLRVYVVWRDNRNEVGSPANRDILGNYSFDGGATWQPNSFVIDNGNSDSERPRVCCEGLNVYVCWRDDRDDVDGNEDIYFNYSRNGGITWQATDTRLDTGDLPGASASSNPRICCGGSTIYVAWDDARSGQRDIFFNYSTNAGVSWRATGIRLDVGDAAGANDSKNGEICCHGLNVYVVWEDDRNDPGSGDENIFINGSTQ